MSGTDSFFIDHHRITKHKVMFINKIIYLKGIAGWPLTLYARGIFSPMEVDHATCT
jgi:hypothetical protein